MNKKIIKIIFCIALTVLFIGTTANCQETVAQQGYALAFNGEVTDYSSVILDNTHYVPMRKVFEKMGAEVFYRSRDGQVLALSRNGDMIYHTIGDNAITINGEQTVIDKCSVLENNTVYVPIDMVSFSFWPDAISYDNQKLNIQKQIFTNSYHIVVNDILSASDNNAFNPEKFREYINYHVSMPAYSIEEVIFRVNLGLDYPFYENVTTIEYPNELLVLVNKYNKLPEGFGQYNLINMGREYTINDGKQYLMLDTAYEKYIEMADAAKKEGLSMRVVSAYRTEAYQGSLYNNKVRTNGKVYADNYSARPGYSEHQTGLAVDINSTRGVFEYTPEFRWLKDHAHEYGYILRYPKGKEWITGYSYEPWHYRYVGTDVAKIIYEEGITYEEYYAKYISASEFK